MDLDTAINSVKNDVDTHPRNFDVSFDLSVVLCKKKKNAKILGSIRGNCLLPNSPERKKKKKVAIIANNESVPDFVKCDKIDKDSLISEIKSGSVLYDKYFALFEDMKSINSLARVLGPKGLMPNAKNGSIISSDEDWKNVEYFRSSRMVSVRTNKNGVINLSVGSVSNDCIKLRENIFEVISYINANANDNNLEIKSMFVNSTMGKGFKFNI